MQDLPHTEALKADLVNVWLPPLIELCIRAGIAPEEAPAYARLGLAASRGLLFDLLLTGDRGGRRRSVRAAQPALQSPDQRAS